MIVREYKKEDLKPAEEIFRLYWTDPQFLEELSAKLDGAVGASPDSIEKKYRFFVAEEGGEVVGIAGFRSAPEYMMPYAKTANPAEFYVLASKYKGRGVGEALRLKRIEAAKEMGFTEAVLYSPNSHWDSWGFHDRLGFERAGSVVAPDGEPGMIWRRALS